jgi:hypothetical protein
MPPTMAAIAQNSKDLKQGRAKTFGAYTKPLTDLIDARNLCACG